MIDFLRISIHMLISHYQSLHGIKSNSEGLVGTIDPQCDLLRVSLSLLMILDMHEIRLFFNLQPLFTQLVGVTVPSTRKLPTFCMIENFNLSNPFEDKVIITFEAFINQMTS